MKNTTKSGLFLITVFAVALSACKEKNKGTLGAQKLDCTISGNQTLTNRNPDGLDYYAECDVEVISGTLTIEPGTSIMFKSGSGLRIIQNGSIRALGSSSSPITMAGETTLTPWHGIFISSNSPLNELSYCNITGGASENNFYNWYIGGDFAAAISVTDGGKLALNNSTVSGSASIGIAVNEDSQITGLANVSVSNCLSYPMLIAAKSLTNSLGLSTCTFTGNQIQRIAIFSDGGTSGVYLNATQIPYYVLNMLNISGGNIVINQGVNIFMGPQSYIRLDNNGYFDINGTPSQPVIIRGDVAAAGYWQGIIVNTNSTLNVFDYLQISDGGSTANCFAPNPSNIQVGCISAARLTLNNCSSTNQLGCQVSYSTSDATLVNNSPDITQVCAY